MKSEDREWKMEDGIHRPKFFTIFHPQSSILV